MSDQTTIRVGDIVLVRGTFGTAAPSVATVTRIEASKQRRCKYGRAVNSIAFARREFGVFSLDNGRWCYGEQIDGVRSRLFEGAK